MKKRHIFSTVLFCFLVMSFILFVSIKTKGVSDNCKDGVDVSKDESGFSCGCGGCESNEKERSYSSCNETDSSSTSQEPTEV